MINFDFCELKCVRKFSGCICKAIYKMLPKQFENWFWKRFKTDQNRLCEQKSTGNCHLCAATVVYLNISLAIEHVFWLICSVRTSVFFRKHGIRSSLFAIYTNWSFRRLYNIVRCYQRENGIRRYNVQLNE